MSEYHEPPAGAAVSQDDRTLAMLTHLSGIIFNFLVPLIIWLINKDKPEKAFLIDQSKEALNFCITTILVYVALFIVTIVTFGLASPLSFLFWIATVVFFIIAGLKANNGEHYRYPVALRLIK
ncbi:DUF4870 domain-containing protein [Luteimonas sp. BDR2-5]|uniref:DUF4870 domain-containing protein n=1 Tax=Proluteimonas luteida TaxID=2878685 RepID=UPI001E366B66|nr:DUF4870 domain-containing protein [Luteimonas sp. BDR2-5]MCD9028103.1 DUF4870 domain-containing protein [Luteimonas sp. BDR2-5]